MRVWRSYGDKPGRRRKVRRRQKVARRIEAAAGGKCRPVMPQESRLPPASCVQQVGSVCVCAGVRRAGSSKGSAGKRVSVAQRRERRLRGVWCAEVSVFLPGARPALFPVQCASQEEVAAHRPCAHREGGGARRAQQFMARCLSCSRASSLTYRPRMLYGQNALQNATENQKHGMLRQWRVRNK